MRQLDEEQSLAGDFGSLRRNIEDRAVHFNAEKRLEFPHVELLWAYQFQHAELDFIDRRRNFEEQPLGLESAQFQRQHHGLVWIAKYHGATGSDFLQNVNLEVSLRHDRVQDEQADPILRGDATSPASGNEVGSFGRNNWHDTMFKFAINVTGYRQDLTFNSYLSFGSNTKFPTLFQQISSPLLLSSAATRPNLNPEKNSSVEIGFVLARELQQQQGIDGVEFSGNFFQNHYDNKFRLFTAPGIPVVFYDNVHTARISGLEAKSKVFLFRKKVTVELGLSQNFISEKAAFPFKADAKRTLNFMLDHRGYSLLIHWFNEGEQSGLVRQTSGSPFAEINLPGYTNIDIHLSKTFELSKQKFGLGSETLEASKVKLFANVSGHNLMNDENTTLRGLAIRDRRFYLTIGVQY